MSNILQVTDPSTYIDNRNLHTGQEQQSALNSSQIQNPSDPSRVVRADGQKSGTAGDQENESGFSVRNYNGNYTDFLQKLGQENEIKDSLGRILFRDGAFIAKGDEGLGKMVQQLLDSASFEDSGQLLDFLKMQGQTKFSGTFFENLRTLLQQEGNRGLQETALKFLQVFNNYSSGEHLLEQMQELTDEIVLEKVAEAAKNKVHIAKSKSGIVVKGIDDVAVRFSRCCNPVPGDEIVGFVTRGRGLSIHRTDCVNMIHLTEAERARLIPAEWEGNVAEEAGGQYLAEIKMYARDQQGLLMSISKVFTEMEMDVKSLNIRTSKQGTATIEAGFIVHGREELAKVIGKLRQIDDVIDIERTTG